MNKWWKTNIKEIVHDCNIVKEFPDRYYLCLTLERNKTNTVAPNKVVSLDPGVRTFQTFYSEKSAGKLGDNACNSLITIGQKIDQLQSILDINRFSKRTRHNLKRRCALLRNKIKNKVNDLHWKTTNYLCQTYKHIFLPEFKVQGMITKLPQRARCINSKTVRNMLSLSHYKFKLRLIHTAEMRGNKVHICNEAYTTRTCGGCGVQQHMGGKKMFKCKSCKFKLDRDFNGARNIYIKEIGLRMTEG